MHTEKKYPYSFLVFPDFISDICRIMTGFHPLCYRRSIKQSVSYAVCVSRQMQVLGTVLPDCSSSPNPYLQGEQSG